MTEVDRRWLFPTGTSPVASTTNINHMEPIKLHSSPVLMRSPPRTSLAVANTLMGKGTAAALTVNGLGCDIMSQINEISDSLYLCGARGMKIQKLLDLGITTVVNVTVELPCLNIDQIESVKIQLEDSPYSNLATYFDRVADKIEEVRRRGGNTVVHCVAGVSRSATLCIAYLMKYKKMNLRQAYHHVKARRGIIRPNVGFFRQLVDYEYRLFGNNSVKMVWNAAAGGQIPDLYEPEYNNTLNFLRKYGLQTDRLGRCATERYRR